MPILSGVGAMVFACYTNCGIVFLSFVENNTRSARVSVGSWEELEMAGASANGLWNIVLSGYPRAGKTMLAQRLVADHQCFARVGVDELRQMLFNENYPCHDEYLVYSMIAETRDTLLRFGYSVVIDSTAPFNVTRQFLLATKIERVNPLLIVFSVDRPVLIKRTVEKFGDSSAVSAYDKRWEGLKSAFPVFKFKSGSPEEFDAYYARLTELLESETHPFKPEFHPALFSVGDIRKALKSFLGKRSPR
jgi:predicted kinase